MKSVIFLDPEPKTIAHGSLRKFLGNAYAIFVLNASMPGVRFAGSGKFEAGETFRVELPLRLGMMVRHAKLGDGRITDFSGHGETLRALVRFRTGSSKWVLWSYGGLEMLEHGLD